MVNWEEAFMTNFEVPFKHFLEGTEVNHDKN
jgi:hypothetical protein